MVAQSNRSRSSLFFLILLFASQLLLSRCIQQGSLPSFEEYVRNFEKVYDNAQYKKRQQIYNTNLKYIKESNCSSMGVNIFTDWAVQEMNQLKGGYQSNIPTQQNIEPYALKSAGLTLTQKPSPTSFDWRDFKAVTSIKNQLNCGACWSYSTTAFFQSDLIINKNYTNEIDLSEQFLLKCDNRSLKCDGGFLFWAMEKIIEVGGMPRESQYPYNYSNLWVENGMCYETDLIRVDTNTRMVSFYEVEDTAFMEKLLLKKPVNVNLCSKDLQFYAPNSGSRTLSCTSGQTNRDHTVLLIGYTETQWIIKNQWSTKWGVQGYGYISKQAANDCCIGKQLFTTGTISTTCKVDNCDVCVEETSCYQCKEGYFVKNLNGTHVCQPCNRLLCKKCVNYFGVCDTCMEGYSVTYPTYNCAKATVENCAFMYNGECSECHEGYVLADDSTCVSEGSLCFASKCSKCKANETTLCAVCQSGYSLNTANFQCEKSIECAVGNCSRCSIDNKNFCEICSVANYEFSSTQQKCVPVCKIQGCSSCGIQSDNSTICVQCLSGFRLKSDNKTCEKCQVKHCSSCLSDSVSSFDSCLVGYYFNPSSKNCDSCEVIEFCIECSNIVVSLLSNSTNTSSNSSSPNYEQSSTVKCTKCVSGYTLSSDGLSCLKCMGSCPSCDLSSLSTCSSECGLMNYLSSSNICQSCQQNCSQCQDNNVCTKCFDGYKLDKGICYPDCRQGSNCSICNFMPYGSVCSKCSDGYKLVNNTCEVDTLYTCLEENAQNPDSCVSCPQLYYLKYTSLRKICSRCNVTDKNCVSCLGSSPNTCSKCSDSFYLSKTTSVCTKCSDFDQNCIKCQGFSQCTKCKSGFFLLSIKSNDQASGVCEACSSQCLTCRYSSNYCLSCKDGYQLSTSRQCLRSMGVKFTFVLDASYEEVLNQLLIDLYQILTKLWKLDSKKYIELISIVKGSIEITGNLHMPDSQNDENAFLEKTKASLTSQATIASYNVLSTKAELIAKSDAPKLTEIDQFPKGMLIGVCVGAGVFFICLVIMVVIGIRKWILNKQEREKRKAQKQRRAKRKEKANEKGDKSKSGISTRASSEKKSKDRSKSRSKSKGKSDQKSKKSTDQADQTEKYINDQIDPPYQNFGQKHEKVTV